MTYNFVSCLEEWSWRWWCFRSITNTAGPTVPFPCVWTFASDPAIQIVARCLTEILNCKKTYAEFLAEFVGEHWCETCPRVQWNVRWRKSGCDDRNGQWCVGHSNYFLHIFTWIRSNHTDTPTRLLFLCCLFCCLFLGPFSCPYLRFHRYICWVCTFLDYLLKQITFDSPSCTFSKRESHQRCVF